MVAQELGAGVEGINRVVKGRDRQVDGGVGRHKKWKRGERDKWRWWWLMIL